MAQSYKGLSLRWLFFPSLMLVFSFVALVPPIFAEPQSFEQRLGCALVEAFLALVTFAVDAYVSPITRLSMRAARVHQLLFLGLQSIDLVLANVADVEGPTPAAYAMLFVTSVCVGFVAVLMGVVVCWPVLASIVQSRRLRRLLLRHQFADSKAVGLFCLARAPCRGAVVGEEMDLSPRNAPAVLEQGRSPAYAVEAPRSPGRDFVALLATRNEEVALGEDFDLPFSFHAAAGPRSSIAGWLGEESHAYPSVVSSLELGYSNVLRNSTLWEDK